MAFESLSTRLSDLEPGIRMIETAYTNGLKLVLGEYGNMTIRTGTKDIDRKQAGLVAKILQRNSADILGIAGNQEKTRALLAETQKTLASAYESWNEALDLWDRLEKSYRKIFTDDHTCVVGETCIEKAVVSCTACGERRATQCPEENSTTTT